MKKPPKKAPWRKPTLGEIVQHIAEAEGLKSQVSIGNIREIVGIFSDLIHNGRTGCWGVLWNNGARRQRKRQAKKK